LAANGIVDEARAAKSDSRWLWRGTAVFAGVAAGVLLAERDFVTLIWAVFLSGTILAAAVRASQAAGRAVLVPLAALALAMRFALAALTQALSPAYGGGFLTGDDAGYFRLASHAADYLRGAPVDPSYGPPDWGGERYLFGAYVYLETALFLVFGANVKILLFLNGLMGVATALLVSRLAGRLFGGRTAVTAATIVAFYPSVLLWSALNLKDALTVLTMVAAVYGLTRMQLERQLRWGLLSLLLAEALTGMRGYVAAVVAGTVPVVCATTAVAIRRRLAWIGVSGVITTAIIVQTVTAIGASGPDEVLSLLEQTRRAMAVGARTAFVDPSESFHVITPAEVPTAVGNVSLGPFPWSATRLADLAVIPQMLVWYLLLVCTVLTLWRERQRLRIFVPALTILLGLMAVFILAEGNSGTLLRHRDMLVPLIALHSSPTLTLILTRLYRRSAAQVRLSSAG
jgi:hypothetical protein